MSGTPGSGNEFSDSDREWYAAVSGQPLGDSPSQAGRDGLALGIALEQRRRELERDPALRTATSDEAIARRRERLLLRAREERVFERSELPMAEAPEPSSNVVEFPWWRRRRPLLAMAASLLLGALVLQQFLDRPNYGVPPLLSGVVSVQAVRTSQPKEAAEAFAGSLHRAQIRAGLFQRGKTYVVDAQLMARELPAAEPAFKALELQPTVGYNRVEFSPPEGAP